MIKECAEQQTASNSARRNIECILVVNGPCYISWWIGPENEICPAAARTGEVVSVILKVWSVAVTEVGFFFCFFGSLHRRCQYYFTIARQMLHTKALS